VTHGKATIPDDGKLLGIVAAIALLLPSAMVIVSHAAPARAERRVIGSLLTEAYDTVGSRISEEGGAGKAAIRRPTIPPTTLTRRPCL
jgi:hypothetical protein